MGEEAAPLQPLVYHLVRHRLGFKDPTMTPVWGASSGVQRFVVRRPPNPPPPSSFLSRFFYTLLLGISDKHGMAAWMSVLILGVIAPYNGY